MFETFYCMIQTSVLAVVVHEEASMSVGIFKSD